MMEESIEKAKGRVEVIVATLKQSGHVLHERMRITSDAVICNQADEESFFSIENEGSNVRYITTTERGAGINRNQGLLRAKGDILLFADDDIVYYPGYEKAVRDAFMENPEADVIIFDIGVVGGKREEAKITHKKRVWWHNCFRFGAVRIAIQRSAQQKHNIWFSMLFGPGAKYPGGEDSLFLSDCLRKGLNITCVPIEIGEVDQTSSTWFSGYSDDYLRGRGVLFRAISPSFFMVFILHHAIKHRHSFKPRSPLKCVCLMLQGARQYQADMRERNVWAK